VTHAPVAPIELRWLLRLRWLTLAAQALALGTGMAATAPASATIPVGLLALFTASNVAFALLPERLVPPIGAVLLADTLLLTVLLQATGGPTNPFTALYFVHITMAAVLLGTRWVLALLVASLAGYAVLFASDDAAAHQHDYDAHLRGMWIAFGVTAALVAFFVTRLTRELARRDRALSEERERTAKSAQVAALTGLAAGAAHELGTPVGTIVIAAGELERALSAHELPAEVMEDVRLIREEGRRCRAVLSELSAASGEARGDGFEETSLGQAVARALDRVGEARVRVEVEGDLDARAELPHTAFAVALANLLRNALDASPPDASVRVELRAERDRVEVQVVDRGDGMSPEVAARATDPFFSTKDTGMGLGLFLVRAFAEQLGGSLVLDSAPSRGTVVVLRLPRAPRRGDA
jgi:two-component system sensor histidine kinase RegB